MQTNVPQSRRFTRSRKGASDWQGIYDLLAPRYDRLHRRWLRRAGGQAQAAFEGAVRALLKKQSRVLDVGCGTGHFARRLIAEGFPSGQMTLVDASASMLNATADLPLSRLRARIEALPFPDDHFEIVTCAWVIETLDTPSIGVSELCRVLRPGGAICVVFCAKTPPVSLSAWFLRQTVRLRGTGCFLERRHVAEAFAQADKFELRWLPCDGPAAALIARHLHRKRKPIRSLHPTNRRP